MAGRTCPLRVPTNKRNVAFFVTVFVIVIVIVGFSTEVIVNEYNATHVFKNTKIEIIISRIPNDINCTSTLQVMSVVVSNASNVGFRNAIRSTWANSEHSMAIRNGTAKVLFFVGIRGRPPTKIQQEMDEHDDIVLVGTGSDAMAMELSIYHFYTSFCPSPLLLRTDDDVVVHLDRLFSIAPREFFRPIHQIMHKPRLYCYEWHHVNKARNRANVRNISSYYLPDERLNFCSLSAYLITNKSIKRLMDISKKINHYGLEDALLTGTMADWSRIGRMNRRDMFHYYTNQTTACRRTLVVEHGHLSPSHLDGAFRRLKRHCD